MGLVYGKALQPRAEQAGESLRSCKLCPHACKADRLRDGQQVGENLICTASHETLCFKRHISFSEEIDFLPSYMVYFAGCSFRCSFCAQGPKSWQAAGEQVVPLQYARIFEDEMARGARTINLLGGEPSLHAHTILAIAAELSQPVPLILNTNMYMSPLAIELLRDVIWLYLGDFKFGNDACARHIAGVSNYVDVVSRNLLAVDPGRLLVRHLLLPGHLECCFMPVARWMAANLRDVPFHLLTTYVPGPAQPNNDLSRLASRDEIATAQEFMANMGLNTYEPGAFKRLSMS